MASRRAQPVRRNPTVILLGMVLLVCPATSWAQPTVLSGEVYVHDVIGSADSLPDSTFLGMTGEFSFSFDARYVTLVRDTDGGLSWSVASPGLEVNMEIGQYRWSAEGIQPPVEAYVRQGGYGPNPILESWIGQVGGLVTGDGFPFVDSGDSVEWLFMLHTMTNPLYTEGFLLERRLAVHADDFVLSSSLFAESFQIVRGRSIIHYLLRFLEVTGGPAGVRADGLTWGRIKSLYRQVP